MSDLPLAEVGPKSTLKKWKQKRLYSSKGPG